MKEENREIYISQLRHWLDYRLIRYEACPFRTEEDEGAEYACDDFCLKQWPRLKYKQHLCCPCKVKDMCNPPTWIHPNAILEYVYNTLVDLVMERSK